RGTPATADSLAGHDVLVPSGELEHLPEARWLTSLPGVRVKLRSSSMVALFEAARAGLGLAVLTRAWGDAAPDLQRVAGLPHLPARPVWLLTAPGASKTGGVQLVAQRIAELMATFSRV
ncbi:MAG: hypothetical protein JNK82_08605, partial [Myxococcaceae bacterium]|nr:hypothetical protein [Myxococcaceae bacterium]